MDTMWAAVVHGADDIRYEQIERPEPKVGEVLVEVKFSGICGSDIPRVLNGAWHFFYIFPIKMYNSNRIGIIQKGWE